MSRGSIAGFASLLVLLIAGSSTDAFAAAPISPGLLPPPGTVPAELRDLEAKTEALQLTSLEVKLTTRLHFAGHVPKGLATLFDFDIQGIETISPADAALKVKLFGHTLRFRLIGSRHFLFSWTLGRHDGGRPWIELGKGPAGKLLSGAGGKPGAANFNGLLAELNEGKNLRALGTSTVDSQVVTGFSAEPQESSDASSEAGALVGFSSAKRRPKPNVKPKSSLSMYFAANGVPVRTVIKLTEGRLSFGVIVDFPAVNFPVTIPAPPAGHVITEAKLRKLFPPRHRRERIVVMKATGGR